MPADTHSDTACKPETSRQRTSSQSPETPTCLACRLHAAAPCSRNDAATRGALRRRGLWLVLQANRSPNMKSVPPALAGGSNAQLATRISDPSADADGTDLIIIKSPPAFAARTYRRPFYVRVAQTRTLP